MGDPIPERRAEEASRLASALAENEQVTSVTVQEGRYPHRVRAYCKHAPPLPDGLVDLTGDAASIEAIRTQDLGAEITLVPLPTYKPAGQRTVREHGASVVVTLTRQSLQVSGLTPDEEVDVEAREGEVRISRRHNTTPADLHEADEEATEEATEEEEEEVDEEMGTTLPASQDSPASRQRGGPDNE
jgi:antitoxin component of MazEF toxin-antitoxin module